MSARIVSHRDTSSLSRRDFLQVAGAGALAAIATGDAPAKETPVAPAETHVQRLYDSLSPEQRKVVCFDWDYREKARGLLRTHISNNWRITKPAVYSSFYTAEQQKLIRLVFEGMINPAWTERFDLQFKDDMGGFGKQQGIAIFGQPGTGKFEFVLSGRHGTMRCDGNSSEHVAFGGPILYGHSGHGDYYEKPNHPGNVFWHQAEAANKLYQMLDGQQQQRALLADAPDEARIAFRGREGKFDGLPVAELSQDQKQHLQQVLKLLIEPYRQADQDEVVAALSKQGGLDKCHLVYYRQDDLGNDKLWDIWRLEGPAFVWHYRGAPHVHVWVNVADDPIVELNSKNLSGPLRR